jgi:hypothetical protein
MGESKRRCSRYLKRSNVWNVLDTSSKKESVQVTHAS